MLSGRRALETVEDRIVELLPQDSHALKIDRVRRIEQRTVVRVPVANVTVDPGDGRMSLREAHEELDELRDPVPGHNRILHEAPGLVGSGPLNDGREDRSAEFPESRLSPRVLGDLGGATQPVAGGNRPRHIGDDRIEISFVEFDKEHGLRASRRTMDLAANQVQGGAVDRLHGTRLQGEQVCDDRAEFLKAIEIQEHRDASLRDRDDPEGDFRNNSEGAFTADKERGEGEDPAGQRVRDRRKVVATGMLPYGTAARENRPPMELDLRPNM